MTSVRTAGFDDKQRWDEFVISHEDAGPYHLFAWKEAVENAYNHKAIYLIHDNTSGNIEGVLPLIYVKPPMLKGILVSQPFCDYGGILTRSYDSLDVLVSHAYSLSRDLNANLELRLKAREPILESSLQFYPTLNKSRMLLELPGSSVVLWNSFKSKLRSQINKPQKDGLTFIMGSRELLDDFYSIFCSNMRSLGSPVHSKAWISSVMNFFEKDAHAGVVYLGDNPIAAGIILCCRDTVSIPWASTLREYNKLSPNMLLYWGFLEYACDNGFKNFDFGRSTPGEGTYKFKEQWGAKPLPLFWYREGNQDGEQPVLTNGRVRNVIEKTWTMFPLALTNSIGPIIRKYITL
jgi:FemAB-related protein (PEP-CTERM system-associated)